MLIYDGVEGGSAPFVEKRPMLVLQCEPKLTSWETFSKGKHTMETERDLSSFSLLKVFKMYFIELFCLLKTFTSTTL